MEVVSWAYKGFTISYRGEFHGAAERSTSGSFSQRALLQWGCSADISFSCRPFWPTSNELPSTVDLGYATISACTTTTRY